MKRTGLTETAFARYFHPEGDSYEVLLGLSLPMDDGLGKASAS
jgi:hypothetical protein